LNYDLKREHILKCRDEAAKNNLKFFVSDAHMKEYSHHAGCCGLPDTGPLSRTNKGQFAHAILIAKEKGFVQWKDISAMAHEIFDETPFFKAEGFPNSSEERAKHRYHNMAEYMHDMWNTPNSYMSPNRYFGGALVAGGTDEDGDIIYLYNQPFIEKGEHVASVNDLARQLRVIGKPNEDRYNEMTADGTRHGHIAYPVFVISRGRWATATTMNLLDQARINYVLVVPAKEYEFYEAKFPQADIIMVPKLKKGQVAGAGRARAFVLKHCKDMGYESYAWILDDDIVKVEHNADAEPVDLRSVLSFGEGFIEDYTNVAMLGFDNSGQNIRNVFYVNQPVQGLMLVNLATGLDSFNPDFRVYEDLEFAVRHIMDGWTTIVHNKFCIRYSDFPGGGASGMYLENFEAGTLRTVYSDYVSSVPQEGVDYPDIQWDQFESVLQNRNVQLLVKGE
jgi:hypothetical protein